MEGFISLIRDNLPAVIWLGAMVVLIVIEASTIQLICIWFAVGALAAAVAAMCGLSRGIQFALFIVISALCLVFTRKFVKGVLKVKKVPTNADSVIGMCGSVLQDIDNIAETGRVRVNGLDWTARSTDSQTKIHTGDTVVVTAIEGVKLIVEPRQ